jgi:DNA-binding GntR family transcriptional regulator
MCSRREAAQAVALQGATVCTIDRQFFENIYRILNALEMLMIESTMENWSDGLSAR